MSVNSIHQFKLDRPLVVMFSLTTAAAIRVKIAALNTSEINLDQIKTTLGMEMLKAQTPEMVRKEIYVHLMAYNLLGYLMWQAGSQSNQAPLRLSVQGSRQSFNQFRSRLAEAGRVRLPRFCQSLLEMIAETIVPLRPNRYEPRKRKRRPKAFPLMNEPRAILKQKLAAA